MGARPERTYDVFVQGAGEVGEIVIRGRNAMTGYWNRPDATKEVVTADGWFHTGDMARVARTATSSSLTERRT
jgi:long-subunit acyl-CoA synthetase (AMP-forming)